MIQFKTVYISSPEEKCTACPCMYLFICRQIQRISPWFRAQTEVKSTYGIMWDIICGDIKAAGVSVVKILGYSLPVPEDCANTPSGRGNTLADDRNGKHVINLIFCPDECIRWFSQRHIFLPTVRSQTGNKIKTWDGKSAHHRNTFQTSLHFFIAEPNLGDVSCLHYII